MIPILRNHDSRAAPIGHAYYGAGKLYVEFVPDVDITKDDLFDIFGNAGIKLTQHRLRSDGTIIVRRLQILEFSLSPTPATQSNTPTTQSPGGNR